MVRVPLKDLTVELGEVLHSAKSSGVGSVLSVLFGLETDGGFRFTRFQVHHLHRSPLSSLLDLDVALLRLSEQGETGELGAHFIVVIRRLVRRLNRSLRRVISPGDAARSRSVAHGGHDEVGTFRDRFERG